MNWPWNKTKRLDHEVSKVQRRAAQIPTADIPLWAEQSLDDLVRCYTAWRRQGERENLDDAILGAEALIALMRELRSRSID